MKKVLVCPPTYFDIEYEINPWMRTENKVNKKNASEQFQSLKNVYKNHKIDALEIEQIKGLPDMVYSANFGFPFKNTFIPSNYKFPQRKKEKDLAIDYFKKLGFEIKTIPDHINWEGQGDLLCIEDRFFLGWGKRSDIKSKQYLEKFLNKKIIDFELVNPYYYHLDTCFLPLNSRTVAINPKSFTQDGLRKIYKEFDNVIAIDKKDNDLLACNALVIKKTIIIGKGISQKLKHEFASFGYSAQEIEMSEFRKGGGSIKCLTLESY